MFDYDVNKHYPKVSEEIIKKYSEIEESASINECLKVSGALNHDFRPVGGPKDRAVGAAFTVRARAGDNLILHKAITLLKPGDFLIVSCDGFQESGGMWGGMMSTAAHTMGAVGMVIDGCCRDSAAVEESGFKIWSRGISVKMSTKVTPGKINVPIVIGNVPVTPGDLVFADNDAVVVVPREQAEEVYEKAHAREMNEAAKLQEVLKDGTILFYGNERFKAAYAHLNLSEEED